MATTIQLKRGTGSAVPSGLEDGELAINLDNGKLYFGSGSTSINSFRFENLTAENYIVSSSVTNITTQTLSGSTSFGDSTDDTHQFTGAITASGAISASGDLLGGGITINGNSTFNSNVIDLGVDSGDRINLNAYVVTSADFKSHITASGNISSSENIIGSNIIANSSSIASRVTTLEGVNHTNSALTVDNTTLQLNTGTTYNGAAARTISIKDGGVDSDALAAAISVTSLTTTNITASGIIVGNTNLLSLGDPDGNVGGVRAEINQNGTTSLLGNATLNLKGNVIKLIDDNGDKDARIELSGPVTASGNISSSGNLTAVSMSAAAFSGDGSGITNVTAVAADGTYSSSLQILSNITASGDISASGTITANAFTGTLTGTATGLAGSPDITIDDLFLGEGRHSIDSHGSNTLTISSGSTVIMQFASDGATRIPFNITASGNISSSGTITGGALQITPTDTSEDATHYVTFQKLGNNLTNVTNGLTFNPSTDLLSLAGGTVNLQGSTGNISTTGRISTTSHITASGDISASNAIISQKLFLREGSTGGIIFDDDGAQTSDGFIGLINKGINIFADNSNPSAASHLFVSQSGGTGMTHGKVGINTITPNEHLEVVGNISSSGTITGNSIVGTLGTAAQTNITSVGTLSALTVSGDITANGNIIGDDATDITNIESIFADNLVHDGDTDTKIAFGTNTVQVDAGGTTVFESSVTGSVLSKVHQNVFDTGSLALTANGGSIGDIVNFGGSSTNAGTLYYLGGDGQWASAQANAVGTATSSLAMAVGTNSTTDGMLLRGFINPASMDSLAEIGAPLYMSDTHAGRSVGTAPSSTGDIVRIVGYKYGADLIYFNPSNEFIIHA